jgi:putative membrane protein
MREVLHLNTMHVPFHGLNFERDGQGEESMGKGRDILCGAAAGCAATVPMTVVMEALRIALPAERHRRMPPREVIDRTIEKSVETTGEGADLDAGDRAALTTVAHLAFGTAAGAVYGATIGSRSSSVLTGIAYGLGVWAVAYGVGLPSLGLHPAAAEDTEERNEVLIASHVVWGAVLGLLSTPTIFGSLVPKQRTAAHNSSRRNYRSRDNSQRFK